MSVKTNSYFFFVCLVWTLKSVSGHEHLLQLSFKDFDQTPGQGWRTFQINDASPEKLKSAAHAIQEYIGYHKGTLLEDQLNILHFHTGQIYAFAHEQNLALEHFKKSYEYSSNFYKKNATVSLQAWLVYVQATIAFLEKDITLLKTCAQELEDMHSGVVDKNTEIVARLLRLSDRSYKEIYFSAMD